MRMRSSLLLFALFSLLLLECNARKEPADYWKSVMKDEAMPEVIKSLYRSETAAGAGRFVKDFDVKPNVIIYHSHSHGHGHGNGEDKSSNLKKKMVGSLLVN